MSALKPVVPSEGIWNSKRKILSAPVKPSVCGVWLGGLVGLVRGVQGLCVLTVCYCFWSGEAA